MLSYTTFGYVLKIEISKSMYVVVDDGYSKVSYLTFE